MRRFAQIQDNVVALGSTGGGAHNVMQPFWALNFVIRT
jgi:hypothetical protein